MKPFDFLLALVPFFLLFFGTGMAAFSLFAIAFGECHPGYAFVIAVGVAAAITGASFFIRAEW